MQAESWLTIASVCVGGAVSPGPSLVLVLRNTKDGGRAAGIWTGLGHGLGVGVYALAAVAGGGALITRHPTLQAAVELMGAAFLMYVAAQSWRAAAKPSQDVPSHRGFTGGFLFAFANPKIAVFFLALLTPFLPPSAPVSDRVGVAAMAMAIDASWYCLVAAVLASGTALATLRAHGKVVDRLVSVMLFAVAAWIAYRPLTQ